MFPSVFTADGHLKTPKPQEATTAIFHLHRKISQLHRRHSIEEELGKIGLFWGYEIQMKTAKPAGQ
jgi:hypothetical protein